MSSPLHDEPTDLVGSERRLLTLSCSHPALFSGRVEFTGLEGQAVTNLITLHSNPCLPVGF